MKNDSNLSKITSIFSQYKKALAILVKKGRSEEVLSILRDSATFNNSNGKSTFDALEKSAKSCSAEELIVAEVNFVFSLLDPTSKQIITNEFILNSQSSWWIGLYSRSTYYRLRKNAVNLFLEYFE